MSPGEIKASLGVITHLLEEHVFISRKHSVDFIADIEKAFPKGIVDKVKIYLNPFSVLSYIRLKKVSSGFELLRIEHNESFIDFEMKKREDFFDNAAAFSLDEQQRRAVIADEDNNLVIAGAGSGKTMTIVAKIKYLTEIMGVSTDTILPISFTRKSADEMKNRIDINGIRPQTFHKFGLTVLQSVERRKPKIFEDTKSKDTFRTFVDELSKEPNYLSVLNNFLMNYVKIPKSQFEFESLGDYIQYMKDQNFSTYKRIKLKKLFKGKETFMNEAVKSIEECIIANFLITNRVEYEYEKQYEHPYSQFGRKKSYKPDFTITTPDGEVYLEHLGMDRDGNVPKFFAGPKETHYEATRRYTRLLEWKKRVHSQNDTKLIESYSYEFFEGSLLETLTKNLELHGVQLDPMSPEEIWDLIQENSKDQVDGFIEICQTFLSLLKSNDYTVDDARTFNEEMNRDDNFMKKRAVLFIDLFEPIYGMYESRLQSKGEIDFNDMISRATEYIANGDYYCPLSYVIVDEFQDLSIGRYKILNAIRTQNPDLKLYCVGDDWQSIYRFAGSDITLFSDFEEHFGYTYTSKIETTYRFNDPLISLSSGFVLKNPHQLKKSLVAPENMPATDYTFLESESQYDDDTDAVVEALTLMLKKGLTPDDKIYIIGRYNFDIQRIQNRNKDFTISYSNGLIKYTIKKGEFKDKTLNMNFITAHKAKGLEGDYCILINCNSGKYGFPSGKSDDPLLNLLLSNTDQFENGEERRLFYVAMTRTKKHLILISNKYRKSKFIKEIKPDSDTEDSACPACGSGELVKRSGPGYLFYGCTNWAYGCKYSTSKPKVVPKVKSEETSPKDQGSATARAMSVVQPSKTSTSSRSKLTSTQKNKLEFFCKEPRKYTVSQKARAKIEYLKSISSQFNDEEATKFNNALEELR